MGSLILFFQGHAAASPPHHPQQTQTWSTTLWCSSFRRCTSRFWKTISGQWAPSAFSPICSDAWIFWSALLPSESYRYSRPRSRQRLECPKTAIFWVPKLRKQCISRPGDRFKYVASLLRACQCRWASWAWSRLRALSCSFSRLLLLCKSTPASTRHTCPLWNGCHSAGSPLASAAYPQSWPDIGRYKEVGISALWSST